MSDEITMLREKLAAAERFKDFTRAYLDSHGVPHGDPDNIHQKEGCRVGARLDLLFAQRDAADAKLKLLRKAILEGEGDCPECGTYLPLPCHAHDCRIGAGVKESPK